MLSFKAFLLHWCAASRISSVTSTPEVTESWWGMDGVGGYISGMGMGSHHYARGKPASERSLPGEAVVSPPHLPHLRIQSIGGKSMRCRAVSTWVRCRNATMWFDTKSESDQVSGFPLRSPRNSYLATAAAAAAPLARQK